jgi:polyphosphate kinase
MKKIISLSITVLSLLPAFAQVSSASPANPPFAKAMQAVLHDFTGNFRSISGHLILQQAETDNYVSLVQLPGATECIITRYHSLQDSTASWQAKMTRNEDFQIASKQYREYYTRLKSCFLTLKDGSSIYLKGEWSEPDDSRKFTVSTFKLNTTDLRYLELQVDLEMLFLLNEWVVNINVSNKKKDTLEPAGGSR